MNKEKKASKTDKNIEKKQNNKENKDKKPSKAKKHIGLLWLMGVSFVCVGLLLFCQFYFGDTVNENTVFYDGTTINGIDVSGLNQKQAENVVGAKMLDTLDEVSLTLKYEDRVWKFSGNDFEVNVNIGEQLQEVMSYGREGNIFEKTRLANKIKKEGLDYNISYTKLLAGLDNKIEELAGEINSQGEFSNIEFNPEQEVMFIIQESKNGVEVDKQELISRLDKAFAMSKQVEIEIPVVPVLPEGEKEDLVLDISMRSQFTTDYSTSSVARKSNVKLALSKFNGMIVEPNQEISFNQTTGARSEENGYLKANIINNGVFVEGSGGGVCQASTTLYNALVLSDIEILEVHHHSLPVSYVPLSSDAMVSEGFADLIFKNTTDAPIYIKTFCDDKTANVQIFGVGNKEGETRKIRSELVEIIAHNGDKIVEDVAGEYSSQVLYKGEYTRVKYPKEGYETKAYLQYYLNGELVKEKEIRHDYYWPQDGVVVEGHEKIGYGMTIPESDVKLIPAQKVTDTHLQNVRNKFKTTYPNAYEA